MMSDRITCLKIVRIARATIFRRVAPNDDIWGRRMLQWIANIECLIMDFSCDFHGIVWTCAYDYFLISCVEPQIVGLFAA
jgi:hypothetical protein